MATTTSNRVQERGPLGVFVEQHGEGPTNNTKPKYARAYLNWLRFCQTVSSAGPGRAAFVNALSASQALSGHLLTEWWLAKIQHSTLSKASETMMAFSFANDVREENQGFPRHMVQSFNHIKAICPEYGYQNELFLLWQAEFLHRYDDIDDDYVTSLERHRHDAALMASCQRTSWRLFQPLLEGHEIPIPEDSLFGLTSSGTFQPTDNSISEYRQRGISWVTEPCPWLNIRAARISNQGTLRGLPRYLWDKTDGCTVEVETLDFRPTYTTISHTWGRWKIRPECWVNVEGVKWRVPKNTLFDVQKLPDIIREMDIVTRYVWIDFFCIPQERSKPEQSRIYNTEVDRQADIFAGAISGVVWLNDIKSWDGLRAAVSWLCYLYLQLSQPSVARSIPPERTRSILTEAQSPSGFINRRDDEGAPEIPRWFSSLWTLQESCLQPHMELLNREGKAMFIGTDTLALDGLLALMKWVKLEIAVRYPALRGMPQSVPEGPAELFRMSDELRLKALLSANSPLEMLGMTSQRHCNHGRARAIMSAIGATDWWTSHVRDSGKPPEETDLVLGRFPLAFVGEIRTKLGAAFFSSASLSLEYPDINLQSHSGARKNGFAVIGSMLPFSGNPERLRGSYTWGPEFHDHPSVAKWKICTDACVEIREVGLVAARLSDGSGLSLTNRKHDAVILGPGPSGQQLETQEIVLEEWIDAFPCDGKVYAVCLCYGGPKSRDSGIILWEVSPGADAPEADYSTSNRKLLVKIGNYIVKGDDRQPEPEVFQVNWLVL
jgi:hypothetical protein